MSKPYIDLRTLRFRVWVDGVLRDEVWIDKDTAQDRFEEIRDAHAEMTGQAEAAGQMWLAEVYDPALPQEEAYVRFGTDAAGMVDPRPL